MIPDWPTLKAFALALNLPMVTIDHPWGNECLKAHGKMWCWWSPYADAAVFKASRDERDMLMTADPDTFFLHPHYAPHNLVLVRAGRIDEDWAHARLIRQWREAAPKRWLKTWDETHPNDQAPLHLPAPQADPQPIQPPDFPFCKNIPGG